MTEPRVVPYLDQYPDKRLNVRIPADLHDKVLAKSQKTGVTISFVVRQALEEWVETKDD